MLLALIALGLSVQSAQADDLSSLRLNFPVTDQRQELSAPVGRDIVLHLQRNVDSHGNVFGWDFAATDRRLENSPDFFYAFSGGHGPQLQQLYAWHFVEGVFPAERALPVYGYPFEVSIRCVGCQTVGTSGTEVSFTAGTVEVSWRRRSKANPRQVGAFEVVKQRE